MNDKIIPITCTSSHLIEIEKLYPIQGNLKNRTRRQLQSLKEQIFKHGFSFPLYIWFDGEKHYTLDGHGRDFISKELLAEGYRFKQKEGDIGSSLPCVFIDADNKVHAKEKLLALNSHFGTITEEGLLEYLFEPGFELNFSDIKEHLDFPEIDLSIVEAKLSPENEEDEREYKFVFSQQQLKEAIIKHFPDYNSLEELVRGVMDYPLAMHQFNKLCSGNKNVGGDITLLFNPHRLETRVNNRKHSVAESFLNRDKGMLSSISQWMSKQQDIVHHRQYIDVAKANTGTQVAHEFRPALARDIYLNNCKKGARVLDPCAGWGGRMMGFAAAGLGGEYFATDPSSKTYAGLLKLKDFLLSAENFSDVEINIHDQPFEDLQVPQNYFDFAFTSPPYFDTEIYSDEETQAHNRYKTIEEFNWNFLLELVRKTFCALKPSGKFLINIGGSQHRFDLVVKDISEQLGLKLKEVFDYHIGRGEHLTNKFYGNKLENTIKANDLFFLLSR